MMSAVFEETSAIVGYELLSVTGQVSEYFWILPILGFDFGTPVALSATKPIPVFQYLFVALCATY